MIAVQVCVETMMHLTCTNMPEKQLETALDKARLSMASSTADAAAGDSPGGSAGAEGGMWLCR